jgi:hypothetical protein
MRGSLAPLAAVAVFASLALSGAAVAADEPHHGVEVSPTHSGLWVGVLHAHEGHVPGVTQVSQTAADGPDVVVAVDPGTGMFDDFCSGANWTGSCVPAPAAPDQAVQLTPSAVLRAFRNLSLPAAELVVQPPGGATLVNFVTNFYTEQGEFTRTVRLLGQRVDLRIWPSQFGWRFGDGRSLASASAGAPYPDLEITHEYARAGGVRPSVDTTYAAEFRVNGGPWRDVDGTVTIPGSPVQLRVRTATPVLVGYH